MTSLFRPEALEHRQNEWLGSVQLIRPLPLAVLTLFVVLAAAAVSAYLYFGHYTHKSRVAGFLVPDRGVLRLVAPAAGVVLESHVVEGQSVKAGDVLFVLTVDQATLIGDTRAAVQASLTARERSLQGAAQQQQQLEQARLQAIDQQVLAMQRELEQMAAEADLQRQRLQLARQAMERFESLRADNFVSAAQVQTKAEEVLALRAQAQVLERQRAAHAREIANLQAQRRELPLEARVRQGAIERDLAELAQQSAENEAKRRIVVQAPQDGTITGIVTEVGHSMAPRQALASLLPANAQLQAHLFAPSSAVGFVRRDQPVLLRYQSFPYQKFGQQAGHVLQVSRTPLQPSELVGLPVPVAGATGEATAISEPLYRITVALDRQTVAAYGRAQPLSPGMQLEADVQLDRRRLIEWLFEPLLGLAGRV